MIATIVFYAFAVLAVLSALVVVTTRNIFHSALALTGCLSVVAGLFVLLGADFLAAGQLLVYVGGIMIIMLFVVMLSQRAAGERQRQTNRQWLWGLLLAGAVGCALIMRLRAAFQGAAQIPAAMTPTTSAIGRLLLGDMLVPFEAVSLVLLAALVGAVLFAQNWQEPKSK